MKGLPEFGVGISSLSGLRVYNAAKLIIARSSRNLDITPKTVPTFLQL
jgi:hypothetical protein